LYFGIASLGNDDLGAAARELSRCLSIGEKEFAVAHYYLAQVHLKKREREREP